VHGPTRNAGSTGAKRLLEALRTAPATSAYLAVLALTTALLASSGRRFAHLLLRQSSTNLHQLARDPIRVLVGSAFWVAPPALFVLWLVLFPLVLAPVERWLGTRRLIATFATGHLGATLVVALGIWAAIRLGVAAPRLGRTLDVGVSYGFAAVAAVLTFRLPGRWRLVYAACLCGATLAALVVLHTFTDAGHAVALGLGYLLAPLVRRGAGRRRPALAR